MFLTSFPWFLFFFAFAATWSLHKKRSRNSDGNIRFDSLQFVFFEGLGFFTFNIVRIFRSFRRYFFKGLQKESKHAWIVARSESSNRISFRPFLSCRGVAGEKKNKRTTNKNPKQNNSRKWSCDADFVNKVVAFAYLFLSWRLCFF